MRNQASTSNINAANVQLYGGRRVLPQVTSGGSPVGQTGLAQVHASGIAREAGSAFNEYLKGLGALTGAGEKLAYTFYDIVAKASEREAYSKLSKAYRDEWTHMMTSEKYFGRNSIYMLSDWEDKQKELRDRFADDNDHIPRGIVGRISDNLNDQFANRIGATQVQRLNEYDHKSRVEDVQEAIDNAATTSVMGDFKALESINERSMANFAHDPVMRRSLNERGFNQVLTAWREANPTGFLGWANSNLKKLEQIGGASGIAHVGGLIRQAQSEARAQAAFQMQQARHAHWQHEVAKKEAEDNAAKNAMLQLLEDPSALSLHEPIRNSNMTPAQLLAQNPQKFMMLQRAFESNGGVMDIPGLTDKQKAYYDLEKGIYQKDPATSLADLQQALQQDKINSEQFKKLMTEQKQFGKSQPQIQQEMLDLKMNAADGTADMEAALDLAQRGYMNAEEYAQVNKVNTQAQDITNIVGSAAQYKALVEPVKAQLIQKSESDPLATIAALTGEGGGQTPKDTIGIALFSEYQTSLMQLAKEMKQSKMSQVQIINELDAMKPGTAANAYFLAIKQAEQMVRNEFGVSTGLNAKTGPQASTPNPQFTGFTGAQTAKMGEGYNAAQVRIKNLTGQSSQNNTQSLQDVISEAFK